MELSITQAEEYAFKIMRLARDTITVKYRFFDNALAKYRLEMVENLGGYVADGETLKIDPVKLVMDYAEDAGFGVRLYLHVMLHGIFLHAYRFDKTNEDYWNMASDIAVENIVLEMRVSGADLARDDEQRTIIQRLKKWVPELTAEKLYREFAANGVSRDARANYKRLFTFDTHRQRVTYKEEPETFLSEQDWKKIAERVKAELDSFSRSGDGGDSVNANLNEATRTRYDYESILRKFAVMGEEIKVNPDEFDYVYYTYGLSTYGNMPLIEPLEYTEDKKIREFVIAIDTSASCRGEIVKGFLQKSFDILKTTGLFATEVNIHVIMCDSRVTSDMVIKNQSDLASLKDNIEIRGFGATDFRPVFAYVDDMLEKKEMTNLKGVIYFTDGFGIYPEKCPGYDTMFVFNGVDAMRPKAPAWAIEVVLEEQ